MVSAIRVWSIEGLDGRQPEQPFKVTCTFLSHVAKCHKKLEKGPPLLVVEAVRPTRLDPLPPLCLTTLA